MLTRKCAIEQLLHEGDFNVRVTIYDPTKASNNPENQKKAWKEVIRNSLGGGIVNSTTSYSMTLQTLNSCKIPSIIISGNKIVGMIDTICFHPQPFRITLQPATAKLNNSTPARVWIIA